MIVVDASVAAKWLFVEPYSAQALALVAASARTRQPIAAPALLPFEVANIIRQRMRREGIRQVRINRLRPQVTIG